MYIYISFAIVLIVLLALELCYFKIADKYNIIDKPNERSSHSTIVLRGGGIIFTLSTLAWVGLQGVYGDWSPVVEYLPFLIGLFLIAGVSFVDDVVSLPDSARLVTQFTAMALMFWNLGIMHWEMWWMVVIALIVCVGATNVINFMDGINGITAGYSLAVLGPLAIINMKNEFIDQNFLITVILGVFVFCFFNFRPKGKAKCFAGDVGSIGIAFILLFAIGKLIIQTGDVTYLLFLLVYGVDGCLTICHRIKLHENLGEAHRKHVYQLMANELKIGHVKVSVLYMVLQLVISLGLIYGVPDTVTAHWVYLVICLVVLGVAYIWFKRKYYHLHEEYLASLKK
jgi:UDP-N-acetylmuramyl pentapeptide phosphotransferase/UDP-N-acetylglucosamine-1-phosphate transferase